MELLEFKLEVFIISDENPMWYWSCFASINIEGVLINDPGLENATLVLPKTAVKNKKNIILYEMLFLVRLLFINIEVK
tara:strand:+ start:817 stop:1050 length:234 start_codon:yes stop_codon:yes gene_type:complete